MTGPVLLARADAGAAMGAGHLLRCLALAQAWQDAAGGACVMVASAPPAALARLADSGIAATAPAGPTASTVDAAATLALAREIGASWIVTDGYAFGAAFQAALQESGTPLLSIDDGGETGPSAATMILDQNLGVAASVYARRPADSHLLLGPGYALLRREYSQVSRDRPASVGVAARILVTLGGGDADSAAAAVVEALASLDASALSVRILAGPAGGGADSLRQLCVRHRLDAEVVRAGAELPQHMRWADVAVAGGGSICWELAFMGVPALVVQLAENQRPIASGLAEAGIVEDLGWHGELAVDQLAGRIDALRRDAPRRRAMSERGRALVDGHGAVRVVRELVARLVSGAVR
jgi:UDP-2,4-diacetamido-2,4,6-trideoxy-beta-L-altropyranose hydrolase